MTTSTPTSDLQALRAQVFRIVQSMSDDAGLVVGEDTPLIGDNRVVDSMRLVELCLALEDLADEQGFSFDWTSEAAMSRSRSMFRTAGALASAFIEQARA